MKPWHGRKPSEQVVRLSHSMQDCCDLSALHLLDGDRVVDIDRLDVNSQAFEQNRPSHGGTGALGIKAHFLALKVGERLDLRASENMELAYVQFGNVADPLIDILDLPRSLILVQDVRVGDGNIDATQIQHVVHVLGSPVTDNWEDSKIVAVIERLGEFGR